MRNNREILNSVDKKKLQVLDVLDEPRTVYEIKEETGISEATIYKYMEVLKEEGFINSVDTTYNVDTDNVSSDSRAYSGKKATVYQRTVNKVVFDLEGNYKTVNIYGRSNK